MSANIPVRSFILCALQFQIGEKRAQVGGDALALGKLVVAAGGFFVLGPFDQGFHAERELAVFDSDDFYFDSLPLPLRPWQVWLRACQRSGIRGPVRTDRCPGGQKRRSL